jgi:hypothetical protein
MKINYIIDYGTTVLAALPLFSRARLSAVKKKHCLLQNTLTYKITYQFFPSHCKNRCGL